MRSKERKKMEFYIEWEIPQLRSINYYKCYADNEEKAKKLFKKAHPEGRIRKIESYYKR